MYGLLSSFRDILSVHGQAHVLLVEKQFEHWDVATTLEMLGMQLTRWCRLDWNGLNKMFPGYGPRDVWGNWMQLQGATVYWLCFQKMGR